MQQSLHLRCTLPFAVKRAAPRASRAQAVRTVAFVKTHDSNKLMASVTNFFRDINNRDLAAMEPLCSDKIIYSDRVWTDHDHSGLPKLGKYFKELLTAYPDYSVHIDTLLGRDDSNTVAAHWTARLTCKSDYHGIPATNKRSVVSGMTLFAFDEEDKIHEIIVYRQPTEEERALYLGLDGM